MKRIPHILICVLTVLVTACSEEVTPTYTVGEANNAITLRAGISTQTHLTRAVEDNHTQHTNFEPGRAKAVLRMDGKLRTYKDGKPQTDKDGKPQTDWWRLRTTATMLEVVDVTDPKHNKVSMDPVLYWDDFHTADPANSVGRNDGLEIYGASVNGYRNAGGSIGTLPDETGVNGNNLTAMLEKTFDWTALQWTLPLDQSAESFTNCDLLTSNNVTEGKDGTLKFDDVKGKSASNLLEFTHAMTCITVELTAGKGFPKNSKGEAEFTQNPSVTLLGFPYVGIVDVINKTTTPTKADFTTTTDDPYATGNIESFIRSGGTSHTVKLQALVFPGGSFDDDATNVLKIMADGNEYLVTATKINDALATAGHATFQQGTNYVFKITVNKTGVDVTANIKEWDPIEAANEAPIINFDKCYGQDGTAFTDPFTLYRSTNKMEGPYTGGSDHAVISYDDENSRYVMTPQLYWPDHKTHYFFRAIWPQVDSPKGPAADKITNTNSIEVNSIEVYNEAYKAGQYPSDLRIGMPRKADGTPDETCKNGHGVEGICATDAPDGSKHDDDGKIHLNFRYAMSQVIVQLKTNEEDVSSTNRVTFDKNTKVEILNGYTAGALMLGDGSSYFKGKTPATYTMSNDNDAPKKYENYRDAIVPQALTNTSGDLAFRITVSEDGGVTSDAYETVLGIKGIQVNEGGVLKTINAWEPGKKYVYTLTITKTGVTVTATIADWDTVTADTPIWM